jgi:hypothetical protein
MIFPVIKLPWVLNILVPVPDRRDIGGGKAQLREDCFIDRFNAMSVGGTKVSLRSNDSAGGDDLRMETIADGFAELIVSNTWVVEIVVRDDLNHDVVGNMNRIMDF